MLKEREKGDRMKCDNCGYEADVPANVEFWVCPNCRKSHSLEIFDTDPFTTIKERSLRPPHYTKGKDTFAWAEQTLTKEACLAIAAFNIHKYNTRDKGQDYEDFGKIIEYANWARSLMEGK